MVAIVDRRIRERRITTVVLLLIVIVAAAVVVVVVFFPVDLLVLFSLIVVHVLVLPLFVAVVNVALGLSSPCYRRPSTRQPRPRTVLFSLDRARLAIAVRIVRARAPVTPHLLLLLLRRRSRRRRRRRKDSHDLSLTFARAAAALIVIFRRRLLSF